MNQAATPDLIELIHNLSPVNELKTDLQASLARSAVLETLSKPITLEAKDDYRWYSYLISGGAVLKNGDTKTELHATASESKVPLFEGGATIAIIEQDSVVLKLDSKQFQALHNKQITDAVAIHQVEVEASTLKVFDAIVEDLESQQFAAKSIAEIALKVRKSASKPEVDKHAILLSDPVLMARILDLASKDLDPATASFNSFDEVIESLGAGLSPEAIGNLAMSPLIKAKTQWLKEQYIHYYDQASRLGALAYTIAKHVKHPNPQHARVAGVLHNLGVVVVLQYIDEHMSDHSAEKLNNIVDELSPVVGSFRASKWSFAGWLTELPLRCNDWFQIPQSAQQLSLIDIVIIACHMSLSQTPSLALPKLSGTSLGLALKAKGIDPDQPGPILAEAAQYLRAGRELLA